MSSTLIKNNWTKMLKNSLSKSGKEASQDDSQIKSCQGLVKKSKSLYQAALQENIDFIHQKEFLKVFEE